MPERSKAGFSPAKKSRKTKVKMKSVYKKKVLKMLAVMESQQTPGSSKNASNTTAVTPEAKAQQKEFLATGRTGRRNALPDILSDHAIVTSSDLPGKLQKLTTNEPSDQSNQPGPSSTCI